MKDITKLLYKAKQRTLMNPQIVEMSIDLLPHFGKTDFKVLCCIEGDGKKEYISSINSTKSEAVTMARELMKKYPLTENAVLFDWSVVHLRTREERMERRILDDDERLKMFVEEYQKAVDAWKDVSD